MKRAALSRMSFLPLVFALYSIEESQSFTMDRRRDRSMLELHERRGDSRDQSRNRVKKKLERYHDAMKDDIQKSHMSTEQLERQQRLRVAKQELLKQQKVSEQMDLPEQPPIRTIAGGTAALFAMARSLWATNNRFGGGANSSKSKTTTAADAAAAQTARLIWKNARKRKPAQWRYALRQFDKMVDGAAEGESGPSPIAPQLTHYEAALVACSKLGYWQRALDLYHRVHREEERYHMVQRTYQGAKPALHVTESMTLSVLRACVRASRNAQLTIATRFHALEAATTLIRSLPLVQARHINKVAAAYQALGSRGPARSLLQMLPDRNVTTSRTQAASESGLLDDDDVTERLNIHELSSKRKSTYSLLVSSYVHDGAWDQAVAALGNMTWAGLYPTTQHWQAWSDAAPRRMAAPSIRSSSAPRSNQRGRRWANATSAPR